MKIHPCQDGIERKHLAVLPGFQAWVVECVEQKDGRKRKARPKLSAVLCALAASLPTSAITLLL